MSTPPFSRHRGRSLLDRHIFRATLGLPKSERLDTAAELRTHLNEQVERLMAQGFARDEAEYLAVKAMGDVRVTNRQLLGHVFTTPLGWGVLGLTVLGLGGWWSVNNLSVFAPRGEVRASTLSDADVRRLFPRSDAPRTLYTVANVRLPPGTQWLYTALVSPELSRVTAANLHNDLREWRPERTYPRNFALRTRLMYALVESEREWGCLPKQPTLAVFVDWRASLDDVGFNSVGSTNNTCLAYHPSKPAVFDGKSYIPDQNSTNVREGPLTLGQWSILVSSMIITNNGRKHDYVYLAVLPSDRPRHEANAKYPNGGVSTVLDTKNWAKDALGLGQTPPFPPTKTMWDGPSTRPAD